MGEIIIPKVVEREKGYMYYVDGQGNLCKAKMERGRKKDNPGKNKVKKEKQEQPKPQQAQELLEESESQEEANVEFF